MSEYAKLQTLQKEKTAQDSQILHKSSSADVRVPDDTLNNSEMLEELKSDLHRRANEIRNTDLDKEAESASKPESRGRKEQKSAPQKPSGEHTDVTDRAVTDRIKAEMVRSFSDDSFQPENSRTQLVGMTETAESSVRRMEYLERERDAKKRIQAAVPTTAVDGDLFDFLLKKRRDGEDDPGKEESNDRSDKADS